MSHGASALGGSDISDDGRFVAFIVPAFSGMDDEGVRLYGQYAFVHDMTTGTTTRASVHADGGALTDGTNPSISRDGSRVSWESYDPYVGADTNGTGDVYVRDLDAGTTKLVTANRTGTGAGDGYSFAGAPSGNGSRVVFTSDATDLGADPGDGRRRLFVRCY